MVREEKMFCTIFKKSPEEERAFQVLRGVDNTKMELSKTKSDIDTLRDELDATKKELNALVDEVARLKEIISESTDKKTVTKSSKK